MSGYIAWPFAALLLGFAGARFMVRFGRVFGMIDIPNDRSSHATPIQSGGGIGISAALVLSAINLNLPFYLWVPATFLSFVSFIDDRINLSLRSRIIVQLSAALAVILLTIPYHTIIPIFGPNLFQPANFYYFLILIPLCAFIAGTANFFNFMDGINGNAGIAGTASFGLIALYAHLQEANPSITLFSACIAMACLGFLPMNFPKARVFMGDGGSVLLGFVFATLVLTFARSIEDFLVLCGFQFTFYADTLTTLFVRWRDGEQLTQGHRRHLYQLFANQMRIPHWQVSLAYGLLQIAIGCLLILLRPRGLVPILSCELILFSVWYWSGKYFRSIVERG
ncbi:MAG: UDP-N-acetylmuramyl pentapeptide phosphotransferase [Deltaproteobacteria bacterium]|nr:UDP-N-acetylmuramyl pentapeptide phosphotransferase [Deltaproteobacteria bacterium]